MNTNFKENCKEAVEKSISTWGNKPVLSCSQYENRPYSIFVTHSWGTSQCDFRCEDERKIKNAMMLAGATNIKIKKEWNRITIKFRKRKDYDVITKEQLEKIVANAEKIAC